MKIHTAFAFILGILIPSMVFCQDTSQNQKLSENETYHVSPHNPINAPQHPIYRDTRLGSSSPLYNTYEKNNYGAGAITTNPNKNSSGIVSTPVFPADTTRQSSFSRDTRLGSSSPLYNTYQKNDYGAGAITTNPNKNSGGSYSPGMATPPPNPSGADTSMSGNGQNPPGKINDSGSVSTNPRKK